MKTKHNNIATLIVIVCFIAFGTLACSSSKKERSEQKNGQTTEIEQQKEITFANDKGEKTMLSGLKGKVVFINFWATWCPPCVAEMPSINTLYKRYKNHDKIVFIMVDVDAQIEKSTNFMVKNNYELPLYIPASQIPSDFLSGAIPTTVIINKKGKMVGRIEGGREYDSPEVYEALDALINE